MAEDREVAELLAQRDDELALRRAQQDGGGPLLALRRYRERFEKAEAQFREAEVKLSGVRLAARQWAACDPPHIPLADAGDDHIYAAVGRYLLEILGEPVHAPAVGDSAGERQNHGTVEDSHGAIWEKCSPICDLHVVRPGKVQCNCTEGRREPGKQLASEAAQTREDGAHVPD